MEFLGLFGYGAKEVFNYNRENFKFDQDQQILRESFRLRMQVMRFKLFREDVRDLVDLTVSRMDIYHLLGAMFLQFCVVLFCEGRVQASAPPFVLSLFLLSTGSAFVYLLLAVWLSMHASIASHSFGVRLLTRFVRLPIPSQRQIEGLRFNLKDFEQQKVTSFMRMPFLQEQEWQQVNPKAKAKPPESVKRPQTAGPAIDLLSDDVTGTAAHADGLDELSAAVAASATTSAAKEGTIGKAVAHWSDDIGVAALDDVQLLPEEDMAVSAEQAAGGEDLLKATSGARPERHIELFRKLQSKWQCYDAYCRVCMSMGVNQILQSLTYYCICHTQVENHSPTTGYALIIMFQATTIGLAILDLSGLTDIEILLVQIVGIAPCLLTACGIANRKHQNGGVLDATLKYPASPLSFLCQVLWLELWFRIAAPSEDESKLPRRFRQTLFLDVFGDAKNWDPNKPDDPDGLGGLFDPAADDEEADASELYVAARKAAHHYTLAQCALRRWRAAPEWGLKRAQRVQLSKMIEQLNMWGNTLDAELKKSSVLRRIYIERELRPWRDLTQEERAADPFHSCLIGPFEHDGGDEKMVLYHYDVEHEKMIFEDDKDSKKKTTDAQLTLSLEAVSSILDSLEKEARSLLETRIKQDLRHATRQHAHGHPPGSDQTEAVREGPFAGLSKSCLAVARTEPGSASTRRVQGPRVLSNFVDLFKIDTSGSNYSRHTDEEITPLRVNPEEEEEEEGEEEAENPDASAGQAAASSSGTGQPDPQEGGGSSGGRRFVPHSRIGAAAVTVVGAARQAGGKAAGGARRLKKRLARQPKNDPEVQAMGGAYVKDFVPERLPWLVVSRMTRVLQFGWFWSGFFTLLKEANIYQVDFQQHPGSEGERRMEDSHEMDPEDTDYFVYYSDATSSSSLGYTGFSEVSGSSSNNSSDYSSSSSSSSSSYYSANTNTNHHHHNNNNDIYSSSSSSSAALRRLSPGITPKVYNLKLESNGNFLRPQSISCGEGAAGPVFVSTPWAVYVAELSRERSATAASEEEEEEGSEAIVAAVTATGSDAGAARAAAAAEAEALTQLQQSTAFKGTPSSLALAAKNVTAAAARRSFSALSERPQQQQQEAYYYSASPSSLIARGRLRWGSRVLCFSEADLRATSGLPQCLSLQLQTAAEHRQQQQRQQKQPQQQQKQRRAPSVGGTPAGHGDEDEEDEGTSQQFLDIRSLAAVQGPQAEKEGPFVGSGEGQGSSSSSSSSGSGKGSLLRASLALEGHRWSTFAATIVGCDALPTGIGEGLSDERCLLLAGFDGISIPLAAISLSALREADPTSAPILRAGLEVPLNWRDAEASLTHLSLTKVDSKALQLWASTSTGLVLGWDVSEGHMLGRWHIPTGGLPLLGLCGADDAGPHPASLIVLDPSHEG